MSTVIQHDCREELKSLSLRATPARLGILKLLEASEKPLDVAAMAQYLEKNKIETDPATVFRIVNILTQKGLIRPIQFNEGKARYDAAIKGDHHHLVCESCGKVESVSDSFMAEVEKKIQKDKKFLIKSHSLEFYGLCEDCQR